VAQEWDEKAVFLAALDLAPGDRAAFLRGACPDEAARDRIEALLRHREQAGDTFTNAPTAMVMGSPRTRQIDEFQILGTIGEGGMGVVYLAEDTILGRKVAVKVLAPHLSGSEQALARFRQEAKNAAALQHPGIVSVFKFGEKDGFHYLVSEYVEGQTLAALIAEERDRRQSASGRRGTRRWCERSATIASRVADALDHAHRAGIVHRDVKPSNILIDREGRARLTDFGIAKHLVESTQSFQSQRMGSCHYMSPEQAAIAGPRIDQRSDIFSLGVVLYELIALRRPFDGKTVAQILRAVSTVDPSRLRTIDHDVPRDLDTIAIKALEKRPGDRYQTAAHMAADLRCFISGDPILAQPPGAMRRSRAWVRRHRRPLSAALSVVLIGLCVILAWGLFRQDRASRCPLVIHARVPGSMIRLTPVEGAPSDSGRTEAVGRESAMVRLRRGHYRITAVAPDGRFAQTSVLLLNPAETVSLELDPTQPDPSDDMVLVNAGTYSVGSPTHPRSVRLGAFYIDVAEVSNAEYRRFVRETSYEEPSQWKQFQYDESLADHPVVGVSWDDAQAFARWKGKRLPNADEWESAMRQNGGGLTPWDSTPETFSLATVRDRDQLDFGGWTAGYREYAAHSLPVRSHPEFCTKSGLFHGATNVREYTDTILAGPSLQIVVKGASWIDDPNTLNLAESLTTPARTGDAHPVPVRSLKTGFRCARSVAP
jgi:serine/threonine protein kinase/formylglycine-generating enzyme required for sulfatase activity